MAGPGLGPRSLGATLARSLQCSAPQNTPDEPCVPLRACACACPQLEEEGAAPGGAGQPVYEGQIIDSSAKGYYVLDVPPRELLLDKEIAGIEYRSSDKRIVMRVRWI